MPQQALKKTDLLGVFTARMALLVEYYVDQPEQIGEKRRARRRWLGWGWLLGDAAVGPAVRYWHPVLASITAYIPWYMQQYTQA